MDNSKQKYGKKYMLNAIYGSNVVVEFHLFI